MKRTTSKFIAVKHSGIHNKGIFAKVDIPKGTEIIEYVGDRITKAESDRRGDLVLSKYKGDMMTKGGVYIFELNKRYDIDGHVARNTAQYINHSCDPNSESDVIKGHIWIIALRDIKKGEELSYDYGYAFDDDYIEHPCWCGSKNCVGYIVSQDDWSKLKRRLRSAKGRAEAKA